MKASHDLLVVKLAENSESNKLRMHNVLSRPCSRYDSSTVVNKPWVNAANKAKMSVHEQPQECRILLLCTLAGQVWNSPRELMLSTS